LLLAELQKEARMTDLAHYADEPKRQHLRALGWHEAAGLARGVPMWRRPDGVIVTEEEAFRQLEAMEDFHERA
jgi:hypothetical protein